MTGRTPGGTPGSGPTGNRLIGRDLIGRALIGRALSGTQGSGAEPAGADGADPFGGGPALPSGPATRPRTVRWAAALLALLTVAATAACAGPPSKGDVHGALLNQSHNNVVILAREPSPEMSPEGLVASFLQALTGDQKDPTFGVAQEYLTADARAKWIPAGSTWVTTTKIVEYHVESEQAAADHSARPAATPSATPQPAPTGWTPGETRTVSVSGPEVAQIDQNGFFRYVSQPVEQKFSVRYLGQGTGWRIAVPPEFRMVNPDAFKRAYQTYQSPLPVYLPTRGMQSPHMDQVYLTQATGKVDDTYDALARAVLHGRYPWQDTGLDLLGPVTVDAGQAVVTLKVPQTGMPNISDLQRALLQTFRDASQTAQLLSPTPLATVQVTYAGCTASVCQSVNVGAESPGPSTVYWVCPQGAGGVDAAIVSRQVSAAPGVPTVCPANGGKVQSAVGLTGIRLEKNSPIAVKQTPDPSDRKIPGSTTMAAVVEDNGYVVVLNDKNTDSHPWYVADVASKVTDLEWDPVDGSLWVVDDGSLYRVRDPGDKPPSTERTQEPVVVPGLGVKRFKPSPDGLRAVVVSPPGAGGTGTADSPQPASMVTIDRVAGGSPTLSAGTEFQLLVGPTQSSDPLTPTLQSVTDAAWADGRTVELLGVQGGSSTPKLYKVYLDGSQDSTIIDPDDAQPGAVHITAATGVTNNHAAPWTISDAPVTNGMSVTFKRNGGSDSFQEIGSNPVVATVVAG